MIIHDDFFLTLVASISSICNGICRPFWGWVVWQGGGRGGETPPAAKMMLQFTRRPGQSQ